MICPNCKDAKLGVTQVFSAGDSAESRNLVCRTCGFRATSLTFIIPRPQERRRGHAAKAMADKIKKGQIRPPQ